MRHCTKCSTDKEDNEFYFRNGKPTGYCRKCFMTHYISPRNRVKRAELRAEKWAAQKAAVVDLPGEMWKPVLGYEDHYEVSNMSRIKSLKGNREKIRATPINKYNGYRYISLCLDNHAETPNLHRIVAIAFIPNPLDLPDINHKDGDKTNCAISNLEWVTERQNTHHSIHILKKHGSINFTQGAIARLALPTKHCRKCDTTKDKTEFHRCHDSLSGLQSYCKSCQNNSAILNRQRRKAKKNQPV